MDEKSHIIYEFFLKGENSMYELRPLKNKHAQYKLEYHLILVTKYRKKCISQKYLIF